MVSIKELDKNELQLYCKELERNTFPPTKVGGFSATKLVLPDLGNFCFLRYFGYRNPIICSVIGSFVAL